MLPSIQISLAPPPVPVQEPRSPFSPMMPTTPEDDDAFRPMHLSPPVSAVHRSPLRLTSAAMQKGLESDRFEALLKATRERNALAVGKRGPDLRKEVALKVHKSKQAERRALFLSKIEAPPSPSAIAMPKTPPESPAVFHYSLPSPGLVSPLALFEALGLDDPETYAARHAWVEQVDFRRPKEMKDKMPTRAVRTTPSDRTIAERKAANRSKRLPSLEQITAHLNSHGHKAPTSAVITVNAPARSPIPLPAFLQSRRASPPPPHGPIDPPARHMLPIGTGRLRLPIRSSTIDCTQATPALPLPQVKLAAPTPRSAPRSPVSPVPSLQITTTVIPRTSSTSPVQLTEANLLALNSRARTARDMLSTLRRRAPLVAPHTRSGSVDGHAGRDDDKEWDTNADERKVRRISAPAELQQRVRSGFTHPVLSIPGGF